MRGSYIVYRFLSLCAFFNAFSLLMFEKSTSVMSSVCLVYALEGMITKWIGTGPEDIRYVLGCYLRKCALTDR